MVNRVVGDIVFVVCKGWLVRSSRDVGLITLIAAMLGGHAHLNL